MVCIPAGVTNVESRAVLDATIQAGAKEAHLIAEPLAAAIGANVPDLEPDGQHDRRHRRRHRPRPR